MVEETALLQTALLGDCLRLGVLQAQRHKYITGTPRPCAMSTEWQK